MTSQTQSKERERDFLETSVVSQKRIAYMTLNGSWLFHSWENRCASTFITDCLMTELLTINLLNM